MALVLNNRVRETTSTTGTGAVTLGGAVDGFQTFAAGIGNSNTTYYAISINTESEWEVGLGTLNGDSSTLTRTTVLESSNSDSAVDFSAGSKEVFCTLPSEKAVYLDGSDNQVGGFSSLVEDTTPQLGGMLDVNGQALGDGTLELLKFSETGSAVNEFTIANAASGNGPTLSSTGSSDSNIDINITPKGTGDVVLAADTVSVGDAAAAATLRSNGAGTLTVTTGGTTDLILSTNNGTASGTFTITDAANGALTLAPNGTGIVDAQGSMNPSIASTGKALIMGF
jgi:hypothetical protein